MMKMKIYPFKNSIFLLAFICFLNNTKIYSQSTNYKGETVSYRFRKDNDTWQDWSKQIKVNLSFKIDLSNKTIHFYNDEGEKFNIIAKEEDISGKDDIILLCLNSRNERFVFRIRPLQEDKLLFFIEHKTFGFIYNVSYLEE